MYSTLNFYLFLPSSSAPFCSNVISPTSSTAAAAAGGATAASALPSAVTPTALANENFDIFRVDNAPRLA